MTGSLEGISDNKNIVYINILDDISWYLYTWQCCVVSDVEIKREQHSKLSTIPMRVVL